MPPRLPFRWLERRLYPDERAEILGDLTEQFGRRAARDGVGSARRWFWRQALALIWGFAVHRRDVVSTDHERTRGRWFLWNAAGDWRYAWRALRASQASTTVAVLTLTLGIGLSTALFSLVNGILLRPLPLPHADRIVRIDEERGNVGSAGQIPSRGSISDIALGQVLAGTETLEGVTPYSIQGRNVTTPRGTEQRRVAEVGTSFFDLVGVAPLDGRVFAAADGTADAPLVAVVSDAFWTRELDRRPDVVGSTLTIAQEVYTIVGVARSALFPEPDLEIWVAGRWRWPTPGRARNFQMWIQTVGRLKAGATTEAATTDIARIARNLAMADPGVLAGEDIPVPRLFVSGLQEDLVRPVRPALVALGVAMALVLLACCTNLANLLLARSTARHREMAVRLALGASRWRIIRPLVCEQILLGSAGLVGGGLVAWWILRGLPAVAPATLPRLGEVAFDATALAFASTTALAISLIVGLLPAWQVPAASLRDASSASSRVSMGGRTRSAEALRRGLVVVQVALAMVLLVGAALLGRTMWSLFQVDPGFDGEGAITFQIGLPSGIWREPGRQEAFFAALVERLRQHPDVVAAGVSSTLPLHQVGNRSSFKRPEQPDFTSGEWPAANNVSISPGYLAAIGTRIVRGRDITAEDVSGSEMVVLIDEELARRYFPGEDPIGLKIDWARRLLTIVGITESIAQRAVTAEVHPVLYKAAAQHAPVIAFNSMTGGVAVRTWGDAADIVPFVRQVVREIDAGSPVHNVMRLDDRLHATFAEPRFYAFVLGLFAVLTLTTSILGVYGVLSYAVERRRTEFGVRRALGAGTGHVIGLVLRQAAVLVVVGLVAGAAVAAAGSGVLRSLLFGVEPLDVASFAAAAALLMVIALVAAWLPARAAVRVDPARTLRAD
ncbi:MAG TPA: ADOP family duplicated permease [Vicinamibacterales bacterium]|nr:ADOP family duplicated permease [Vicinamibacterales bacterium]